MGDTDRGEPALRVVRGQVSDDELAALTVVLLALSGRAADDDEDQGKRPVNGSRWWRRPAGYQGSRSWQ